MSEYEGGGGARRRRRSPYAVAAVLAMVMFMVIAPEINEGHAMDPTIRDGQFLVVSKSSYSIKRKVPKQGRVVILKKALSREISDDNVIARVIGTDGDHVVIKDGKVFVNDEEYVAPGNIRGASGNVDVRLEGNEVFLLCDNRKEKMDSRNPKLGLVDMRQIKGNVLVKIWPLSDFGKVK